MSLFPNLDHFTLTDAENVYEPSDDTFLLCDAIEKDIEYLKQLNPSIILEIGYEK
jgi:release factor glutamine methyltransferase